MRALADLIAALAELPRLDPVERARRTPDLSRLAVAVLGEVRAAAVAEALAAGRRQADIARALGITRAAVGHLTRRARTDSEETP